MRSLHKANSKVFWPHIKLKLKYESQNLVTLNISLSKKTGQSIDLTLPVVK